MTRVVLTPEHIAAGATTKTAGPMGSSTSLARRCPLALAIRDAFPGAREVVVGMRTAVIDGVRRALPDVAQNVTRAVLLDRRPAPCEFDL